MTNVKTWAERQWRAKGVRSPGSITVWAHPHELSSPEPGIAWQRLSAGYYRAVSGQSGRVWSISRVDRRHWIAYRPEGDAPDIYAETLRKIKTELKCL